MGDLISKSKHILTYPTSSVPYLHADMSHDPRVMVGDVKFTDGQFKAWDGCGWVNVANYQEIEFFPAAEEAIDWAIAKKRQEEQEAKLAAENPGFAAVKQEYEAYKALLTGDENES